MIYLFIHQNFPAQYVHIARHLASQADNQVFFITQMEQHSMEGVTKLVYRPALPTRTGVHPYTLAYDTAVHTAAAVMQVCKTLRDSGITPDIVIGHCGWGETLFVKDVFPNTPLLAYFEYFYKAEGADIGFDPEFAPSHEDDHARLRVRNTINRMCFDACDWGHTATEWQRSLFPEDMQARITVLHEGVDTDEVKPNPNARLELPGTGIVLTPEDEVITYVARNLEPYRGFHCFMRALPEVLSQRPKARVVIVGGDGISYGDVPPYGGSYRQMLLAELGTTLDKGRVHFLGQVPRNTYLRVLQVSSLHVYFTYPFVLSWSLVEAMSAGCLIVASNNAPVTELINGCTGILVDIRGKGIAKRIISTLHKKREHQNLGRLARVEVEKTLPCAKEASVIGKVCCKTQEIERLKSNETEKSEQIDPSFCPSQIEKLLRYGSFSYIGLQRNVQPDAGYRNRAANSFNRGPGNIKLTSSHSR